MRHGAERGGVLKRVLAIYAVVLVGVEAIVLVYYSGFGRDRLVFELLISAVITSAVGLPVASYVVLQNEKLRALTGRLAHLSATDRMTGLLNRHTFLEQLDLWLLNAPEGESAGVFAFIDADHFKAVNDRFGHAVGDGVIVMLGERIRAATRAGDLCGRLGGEEFGIFFKNVDLAGAAAIAERLRADVERSAAHWGLADRKLSISIGLARHKPGSGSLATMREADASLYAAKNDGRNAVVVELKPYRAA